jgi:alcohol dehydrogenase YqhD (iron-dependent ADH family)
MVHNFIYYTPTKVVFGKDTEKETGKLVREQGCQKVLIVYGGGSVVRSGLLDRVKKVLTEAEVAFIELGGVVPNPHLSKVYEGIDAAKKFGAQLILAVGGGSVIDTAKAIGYGVANEGDVWDFYDFKRQPKACLPIGVVLTIAATGSEMSDSSVITKEEGGLKRACNTNLARPAFAVMDPELTETLPDYQTACGCSDIIMHTMERYFTNGDKMEITDTIAKGVIQTTMQQAVILRDNPKDYDARAEVLWTGSLSHNGLTGCGNTNNDFASHRLEHEIGGMFDVAHGAGLTAIWGSWARYVYKDCLPRFHKFAVDVMGITDQGSAEEVALKGIAAMEAFFTSIKMPINLHQLGINPTEEQLKILAHKCSITTHDNLGSAKVLHEADMLAIYQAANK